MARRESELAKTTLKRWKEAGFPVEFYGFSKEGRITAAVRITLKKGATCDTVLAGKLAKTQSMLAFSKGGMTADAQHFLLLKKADLVATKGRFQCAYDTLLVSPGYLKQDYDTDRRVKVVSELIILLSTSIRHASKDEPTYAGEWLGDFITLYKEQENFLLPLLEADRMFAIRMERLKRYWNDTSSC